MNFFLVILLTNFSLTVTLAELKDLQYNLTIKTTIIYLIINLEKKCI